VLGYELVRLAREADPYRRLVDAAYPELADLRDDAGESTSLGVPRGRPGMEILLQLDAERHVGVANWVGVDVPLHASSAGKLILGDLDPETLDVWLAGTTLGTFTDRTITDRAVLREEVERVRRQRWAEIADELETGHAALSVPVARRDGSLAAVIGVSGPTSRLGKMRRRELLPRVRTTAEAIERAID
jgi:IclR family transcriptional regulator, acetate operon repressor